MNPDYDTQVYEVTAQVGMNAAARDRAAELARVLYRTVAVKEWFAMGGLSTIQPFGVGDPANSRWYLLVYSRLPRKTITDVLAELKLPQP